MIPAIGSECVNRSLGETMICFVRLAFYVMLCCGSDKQLKLVMDLYGFM